MCTDQWRWRLSGGLANRSLGDIRSIGIDEIAWRKGHKYQGLVYQIDAQKKLLLWISDDRKEETLQRFFDDFGEARSAALEYVCSDM